MPNIHILLPVYGQPRLLDDCIRTLCYQVDKPPLLLWDDGSDKLTAKLIDQFAADYTQAGGVSEVLHYGHQGIHKLWNQAMSMIMESADNPDWIMLLASDTMLMQPNAIEIWLEEIALLESRHGRIGACHAALYISPEMVQWCGSVDGAYEKEHGITSLGGHLRFGAPLNTGLTPWVTHSAVMLNTKALRDVKHHYGSMYDEEYEVYCGDRDMSYRMRDLGWQCATAARVQVLHQHGGGQTVDSAYKDTKHIYRELDNARMRSIWKGVMYDGWS